MIAGRYTLEREIGRGGAGTVHLGRDEVLGRPVAIKRIGLMPGAGAPNLGRAEREARLAAALNHPHVVAVFDLVEEDDCHWLVMEYVEGPTLTQVIRAEGPLETRRIAKILGQSADALSDAHDAGIVHRDVKPSNILLTPGDEAKLGDFGIARASSDPALTQTGLVTGSPAYLAPEVASGATATPASDVWSLGATLYHAAVGAPPYEVGDNLIGGLFKIVHEEPPRLPRDHPLAGLLSVMMVKDPDARWPMARVRDELVRVARGEPATVPPPAEPSTRTSTLPEIQPTPASAPAPEPAPAAAPDEPRGDRPAASGASAGAARGRSRTPLLWVAGLTTLALVVLLFVWLSPGDGQRPAADDQPDRTQEPTSQEPPPPSPDAPEQVAAEMDAFVTGYLEQVTSQPRAAFQSLTPAFQEESGGFDGFMGWWGTVETANPRDIQSDPENLTVAYTVDYVMKDGRRTTEQVQLQLQREDRAYLIAGEG